MKKIVTLLLIFCLIFSLAACGSSEAIYVKAPKIEGYSSSSDKGTLSLKDTEGLTKIGENDYLQVFYNTESYVLTVFDRRTGKSYSSAPEGEKLSKTNERLAMLSLIYSDFQGKSGEIDSYTKSVVLDQVETEKTENGMVFNYKIGDFSDGLEVTPQKLSGKRFEEFLGKLDSSDQRSLKRRYSYEKETDQWIRRKNIVNPKAISDLVEIFRELGYTAEDLKKDNEENGVKTEIVEKLGFFVPLKVELAEDSVLVSIDLAKITYPENNKLTKIKVLPLFGAAAAETEGYYLLPDGSGAVMPFKTVEDGAIGYNASVYGQDDAVRNKVGTSKKQNILLPVFGAGYKNGGYLTYIEEGEALADIIANNCGSEDEYNKIYSQVNFLKTESVALGDQNASDNYTYYNFQEKPYNGNYTLRYIFAEKDAYDYSSLAKLCRNYLETTGKLKKTKKGDNAPFVLESVGGMLANQSFLGFTYEGITPITKYNDNILMADKLKASGVENINIRLTAFKGDGLQNSLPMDMDFISKLGGKRGFKELIEKAKEKNIRIYPDFEYLTFTGNSSVFTKNSYAAKTLDMKAAGKDVINPATGFKNIQLSDNLYYLTSIASLDEINDSVKEQLDDYEIKNISIADLGGNVSSDFSDKAPYDRQSATNKAADMIKGLSGKYSVMLNAPSAFSAGNADIITEAPIWSSQYAFAKDIPFYSMVYHGFVDYTGTSLNLTSDRETEFLRCIEYGALLKYTLAYRNTDEIKNSDYTNLYSASFEQNLEDIKEKYPKVNELYKKVADSKMTGHKAVNNNVYVTAYENGVETIVNYSDSDYSYDGVNVPAKGFIITGKED